MEFASENASLVADAWTLARSRHDLSLTGVAGGARRRDQDRELSTVGRGSCARSRSRARADADRLAQICRAESERSPQRVPDGFSGPCRKRDPLSLAIGNVALACCTTGQRGFWPDGCEPVMCCRAFRMWSSSGGLGQARRDPAAHQFGHAGLRPTATGVAFQAVQGREEFRHLGRPDTMPAF